MRRPIDPNGGKSTAVRLRMVPAVVDRLDELAARRGTDRSTLIRAAVDRLLAAEEVRSA